MNNKTIEGYLESISFCLSQIKEHEEDIQEYLEIIQRRISHIWEELDKS